MSNVVSFSLLFVVTSLVPLMVESAEKGPADRNPPTFVEDPSPELVQRFKQQFKTDFKCIVGVRLVALNEGEAKLTSTSWLPLKEPPDDRDRVLLFNSATMSMGWGRGRYHSLGDPLDEMKREGFRFHELSVEPPEGDPPPLSQYTQRGEMLKHLRIWSEATCFMGLKRIDEEQFELSLDYLGMEFPEPFELLRDPKEEALYGVITTKPIKRKLRFGEEISVVLVDDKDRKATKTAYIRIMKHEPAR